MFLPPCFEAPLIYIVTVVLEIHAAQIAGSVQHKIIRQKRLRIAKDTGRCGHGQLNTLVFTIIKYNHKEQSNVVQVLATARLIFQSHCTAALCSDRTLLSQHVFSCISSRK